MNLFYQALEKNRDNIFILQGEDKICYGNFLDQLKPKKENTIKYQDDWNFLLDLFSIWKMEEAAILLPPDGLPPTVNLLAQNKENCLFIPTSGSTGTASYLGFNDEALFYSAKGSVEFYQINESDINALSLPPYHVGGLMIILRTILAGGTLKLKNDHWGDLLLSSYDFISLVPKQLQDLIENKKALEMAQNAKAIIMGGAATSEELFKKGIENHLPLSLSYGLTESASQIMATKPGDQNYHLGEILPYRKIRIEDDHSILIGGKTLCSSQKDNEGFIKTQDKVIYNEQKQIIGIERQDDMIISGGKNLSPLTLKSLFLQQYQQESINDCEILKCHHPQWGEVPLLAYEGPHAIKDLKFETCPKWMRPKHYLHFSSFPRKGIKVNRTLLQREVVLDYLKNQAPHSFRYRKHHEKMASPLIVFLHGFMGSAEDEFFHQLPMDVLSLNLHSMKNLEAELKVFIDTLLPLTTLFYAYSMGGRLLLSLLNKKGTSFNGPSIIIESSHLGLQSEEEKLKRINHDQSLANKILELNSKEDYREFLHQWYDAAVFKGIKNHPTYSSHIEKKVQAFSKEKTLKYSQDLKAHSLGNQELINLKDLNGRFIFIAGEDDQKFLDHYHELLTEGENKKLLIIESASHNCHLQNPGPILEIIQKEVFKAT